MKAKTNVSLFELISQLRFPLIVLVTYAHSYGGITEGYSLLSSGWDTYEVLKLLVSQTLVKVAVPVFYIMSGYLFFCNVSQWSGAVYRQKLWRRVRSLLLPYVFWNLLVAIKYHAFSWHAFWDWNAAAGMQIDWFGSSHSLTAPANMPLWFLRDLIVVSLLTPIIYLSIRKCGSWLMAILTIVYLSGICPFIPGLSAYAVYFFTFGAFLSIRNIQFTNVMQRIETPTYILSGMLMLAMMLTYRMPVFSSLMLCFRLVGAIAVFCLMNRLLSCSSRRLPAILANSSYFVYLAHYVFFFSFIDKCFFWLFGNSTCSMSLHYLFSPLLKVALLVTAYFVWNAIIRRVSPVSPSSPVKD